jgi:hypothetical protein
MIICDKRLPSIIRQQLSALDYLIELNTDCITYPAISGHPDIFFCKVGDIVVVSPTLPRQYCDLLIQRNVICKFGTHLNTSTYPGSAIFNAVVTDTLFIHHLQITDPTIIDLIGNRKQIHVNQGYTRCNLLPLPDDCFITSDKGIYTVLTHEGFEVLYVDPTGIILDGFPNGFIGGACGIKDRTVYIAGSLKTYKEGSKMIDFFLHHSITWIELYDGPLIDGGSILFLQD